MLELEIEELLLKNGADLVGFFKLEKSPIESNEGLIYGVTIARKLSDAVLKTITTRPTISYFQHYRMTNTKLDLLSLDLISFLEKNGYEAFPIAASQSDNSNGKDLYKGVFQHKTGARLSGLGFIGKSGLLLTKEYGSKVRFATVLTNLPLSPKREIIENACGNCNICVKACPGGAISGIVYKEGMAREDFFDAEKCSSNMKTYKDVGRGAVCGICIKVCPYNKL